MPIYRQWLLQDFETKDEGLCITLCSVLLLYLRSSMLDSTSCPLMQGRYMLKMASKYQFLDDASGLGLFLPFFGKGRGAAIYDIFFMGLLCGYSNAKGSHDYCERGDLPEPHAVSTRSSIPYHVMMRNAFVALTFLRPVG